MWCRETQTTLGVTAAAVFHFLLLAILISLQLFLLEVCDPEVNLQIILQNSKEDGDPVYSKKASDDPVLHTIFRFSCWKYSSLDIYAADIKIRQAIAAQKYSLSSLPKYIRPILQGADVLSEPHAGTHCGALFTLHWGNIASTFFPCVSLSSKTREDKDKYAICIQGSCIFADLLY